MACSWGSRQTMSGNGSFFYDQAKLLESRGFFVEMLVADYSFGFRNDVLPDESKAMGSLNCHFIQAKSVVPFFPLLNLKFHGIQLMRKVKRLEIAAPDLIICQSMIELSHLATLLKNHWSCPVVFVEHHSAFTSQGRYHLPVILPNRINEVKKSGIKVFAVSQFLKEELIKFRQLPGVQRVFNPVPSELENRAYKAPDDVGFRFVAIGRFDSNKRIDLIARAFCEFHAGGGKGELLLITGEEGREPLNAVIEANPEAPIDLSFEYGKLGRERVFREIEAAHVVISCSKFETFGMTILESLSLGRPVLSSDSGGPRDLMNETNGVLMDIQSDADLASGMKRIQANYSEFDLEAIKKTTIRRFCIENWIETIIELAGNESARVTFGKHGRSNVLKICSKELRFKQLRNLITAQIA